jgi:hypothetical protein
VTMAIKTFREILTDDSPPDADADSIFLNSEEECVIIEQQSRNWFWVDQYILVTDRLLVLKEGFGL